MIDLQNRCVLARSIFIDPPYREFEPNPRGGSRGCRGLIVCDDQVYISHYSIIFRFNPNWELLGTISHPACSGIHEISLDKGAIWVTSTSNDLLFTFDPSGNLVGSIDLRASCKAIKELEWKPRVLFSINDILHPARDFRNPGSFNPVTFNGGHVNSACILPTGDVLVSLGRISGEKYLVLQQLQIWMIKANVWSAFKSLTSGLQKGILDARKETLLLERSRGKSAVIRIDPQGKVHPCMMLPNMTAPSHSIYQLQNGRCVYLNTTEGTLIQFDPFTGVIDSRTKIAEGGFLRGITWLSDDLLAIGNLGEIIVFDLRSGSTVEKFNFVEEEDESVFGLQLLGDQFSLPPFDFRLDEELVAINANFESRM